MVKDKSLAKLLEVSSSLYRHANRKGGMWDIRGYETRTTDLYLSKLGSDISKNTECDSLKYIAEHLKELKKAIETQA